MHDIRGENSLSSFHQIQFPPRNADTDEVFSVLTDGCSSRSTGVAGVVQTTQSRGGSLSNRQLQHGENQNAFSDESELRDTHKVL